MDRNQRSRNQKKVYLPARVSPAIATPKAPRRSAAAARRAASSGQRAAASVPQNSPNASRKSAPPQPEPQKPGYRSSAPQVQRRVTRAEQLRIRRRKAIIGVLCVLAVLVVGIVLSINLLFKVTDFRVENADRTTPANTGI